MTGQSLFLTDTDALSVVCRRFAEQAFVCIDTEFIHRTTYYAHLCLVQMGSPAAADGDAFLVDPLADGMDLSPFYELLENKKVTKVLHGCSQDLEIFLHQAQVIPTPLFDTQIANAICGGKHMTAYDKLVQHYTKVEISKSARMTDWAQRPLKNSQMEYALADVLYLPKIYESMMRTIERAGRESWMEEEVQQMVAAARYYRDPEEAWRRLAVPGQQPGYLTVLRALASWREREARRRDMPLQHVMADEVIQKLAKSRPGPGQRSRRVFLLWLKKRTQPENQRGHFGGDCPWRGVPGRGGTGTAERVYLLVRRKCVRGHFAGRHQAVGGQGQCAGGDGCKQGRPGAVCAPGRA